MTRPGPGADLPEAAYATALASLSGLGGRHLRRLLAGAPPSQTWARVRAGHPDDDDHRWQRGADALDVLGRWRAHGDRGIGALWLGGPDYPAWLSGDPEAPAVLFHLGAPAALGAHPRVAIVGTRHATRYGLGVAAQFGADLAAAGVVVVSGLALGIDGAAHEGACAVAQAGGPSTAAPIAVVAGGLDDPYPRRHGRLWQRVADTGVIVSEAPVGATAQRWRFPRRNRLLATMGEVVVVVESHSGGAALGIVQAAWERGIAVGAVPGSIRSPASVGTNSLLADGCFPVRDVTDILVALEIARAGSVPVRPTSRTRRAPRAPAGSTAAAAAASERGPLGGESERRVGTLEDTVLEALGWEPCAVEQLLRRTGLDLSQLSAVLERLAALGKVTGHGGWWERS